MKKPRATFHCDNSRPCFARDKDGHCTALGVKPKGICTFRKQLAGWTKGKFYPYINPQIPAADLRAKGVKR